MYTLKVRVISGKSLPVGDMNGFSDPYVRLIWAGNDARTSTKKKTLNPYWDEIYTLHGSQPSEPLQVMAMDWDRFSRDDLLGVGTARLDGLSNHNERIVTVRLSKGGTIDLGLTPVNFPASGIQGYGGHLSGEMTVEEMIRQRTQQGQQVTTTTTTYNTSTGYGSQQPYSAPYPQNYGPPSGSFGPSSMGGGYAGFGSPSTTGMYGPPTTGLAPPSSYATPPTTGLAPPSNRNYPTLPGPQYTPPSSMGGGAGYGPPSTGSYGPPSGSYGPPTGGGGQYYQPPPTLASPASYLPPSTGRPY
eukprot:TRINITY_DN689_c0_g1_i1.p1 TRINITY_DN689_c0_g1~~TRINITY_DN689_c0_g1_i1.p1  ORF type:complete len:301 (+),score=27.70 TRINITY_DN689_c0_g1_i1:103-1005(+)